MQLPGRFTKLVPVLVGCVLTAQPGYSSEVDKVINSVPKTEDRAGEHITYSPAFAVVASLQKAPEKIYGNWSADLKLACRSATRDKFVARADLLDLAIVGRCAGGMKIVRARLRRH